MNRIYLGFFSEFNLSMADNGSIKDFIIDRVDYDKYRIIRYLKNGREEAVCPKVVYDLINNTIISTSFSVLSDGEYVWRHDLEYYVKNYNIKLPDDFIRKIYKSAAAN